LKINKEPLSLETPIGEEGDSYLGDLIEDQNAIQPIDAMIQSHLRETASRALASLTPREERIVRMRFGLGMNSDHTLEEVGQQFSVTRERIRQMPASARHPLKRPLVLRRPAQAARQPRLRRQRPALRLMSKPSSMISPAKTPKSSIGDTRSSI
jgi:DNA-directed RNA polymerase sigma subunit (sigma70/sigma32)